MTVIYIATDRPGAGKTAAALGMASHLAGKGKRVAYLKLFSGNPANDPDVAFAAQILPDSGGASKSGFPLPISDLASNPDQTLDQAKGSLNSIIASHDYVVAEGPSLIDPAGDM